jgi:plastocyanin
MFAINGNGVQSCRFRGVQRRKGESMAGTFLRRLLILSPFTAALLLVSVATFGLLTPHTASAQTTQNVTIQNFAFSPASLTINVGDTVTWTNMDSVTHTATATDGSFDTGNIASGASGSVTFDTAGTFNYICSIHPNMTGTIIVQEAAGAEPTATSAPSSGLPSTGSGSSFDSAVSQTSVLLIAAAVAFLLGVVALRLRHVANRS